VITDSARHAFDRHAPTYDEHFSALPIAEDVRRQVWRLATAAFGNATRILDLGCGTGEDAIHFAQQGLRVTAVDTSSGMLARLESKRVRLGLDNAVECIQAEMHHYNPAGERFEGIFSNFAAMNCVQDLGWLRKLAEQTLRPGSCMVLTLMGRIYPLEVLLYLAKADPRRAFRRMRSPSVALVDGVPIHVYYHSIGSVGRMLGPSFHLESIVGLCSLSPSPGWEHLQRSKFVRALAPLDRFLCKGRRTATFADHFSSVWRYQP